MSATFRLNTKKKISQNELRRLMAEQKGKIIKETSKINNPLAKYNEAGQLTCALCNSVVRSENVWQVHVNTKQHRNNVEEAKRLKELTNNFTSAVKVKKRSSSPPQPIHQEKKLKGILKNALPNNICDESSQITPKNNAPNIISHHDEEIKRAPTFVSMASKLAQKHAKQLCHETTNALQHAIVTACERFLFLHKSYRKYGNLEAWL
ncbi:Zinc finger protein 830 [Eumeta japonica]|uniref:Zinc finger protein 830 n=1 Tax=Eumeta variegata TaxID=151549 RepID=A0A4C1WB62_EUMVA|nr:Zinc finger protein 830 [Eumeta japonica]